MKKVFFLSMALAIMLCLYGIGTHSSALAQDAVVENADLIALGKVLFFDPNLSVNGTQSCATCHASEVGFTGPDSAINAGWVVYPGALEDRFGNRKPPAASYAGDSPIFHYSDTAGEWMGGMFWDGRATGATLGDPLAEQAAGPFLNPLEMGMPNARLLCNRVYGASYASLFKTVWGEKSLNCAKDANGVYERIARSVAAYERSAEVNPFSSKFDLFWDNATTAGKDVVKIKFSQGGPGSGATATSAITSGMVTSITLTNGGSGYTNGITVSFMGGMGSGAAATATVENGVVVSIELISGGSGYRMAPRVIITANDPYYWQNYRGLGFNDGELQGLAAFNDPNRANCASCHSLEPGSAGYPLFTNFGYDNLGIPKNPDNPFYTMDEAWNRDGVNWVDYGLGGYLKSAGYAPEVYEPELGKFKVPTLRNVDLRPSEDFVKAYGHNGYFKSLEEIVFFYHWRGMMDGGMCGGGMGGGGMGGGGMGGGGMGGGCSGMETMFPAPEVDQNRVTLGMFPMPLVNNIVAFLKTLSDGYFER